MPPPDRAHTDALSLLRQAIERFGALPDDVWEAVRKPWRLRAVRRGEVLTAEGARERRFGLVVEGVQRLYFTTPPGDQQTMAFAYPPDFTGVPDAFFLQTPSAYTLEAVTAGAMLVTDHAAMSALMAQHRALERWAWRLFANALAGRAKRERELLTLPAEARYARLLRESPQVLHHVPLKHVASYLGMTPETLSRVRAGIS